MIIIDSKHFLFIEPTSKKMEGDVIDDVTLFVEEAMKKATPNQDMSKGWQTCACKKAHSDSYTLTVNLGGKKFKTNSLAHHYIKNHRSEVPQTELDKIFEAMKKIDDIKPRKPKI